jgi:LysM repeat protein
VSGVSISSTPAEFPPASAHPERLRYPPSMTVTGDESVEPKIESAHAPTIPELLPDRHSAADRPQRPATDAVCPYLIAASGGWRSALPHRDHRCGAVDPAALLSADKQRRLCLSLAHQSCPTYGAARGSRAAAIAPGVDPAVLAAVEAARRPVARSAPLILEQPRLTQRRAGWPLDRAVSQIAVVGLMVVAVALVAIARLAAGGPGATSGSPSAAASVAIVAGTPSPPPIESPSPATSGLDPSQSAGPSAPAASAPTFRTTYTVRANDTLVGIAKQFGTTVPAIKKVNNLTSNTIHTGQKLKIP